MKGSRIIVSKSCSMACPKLNFLKGNTDTLYFLFISFQIYVNMQKHFHFTNITIEDTREQKYFIVHQYSTVKDGMKNSCDKHRNHVLPNLFGAGGHQTGIDI